MLNLIRYESNAIYTVHLTLLVLWLKLFVIGFMYIIFIFVAWGN